MNRRIVEKFNWASYADDGRNYSWGGELYANAFRTDIYLYKVLSRDPLKTSEITLEMDVADCENLIAELKRLCKQARKMGNAPDQETG